MSSALSGASKRGSEDEYATARARLQQVVFARALAGRSSALGSAEAGKKPDQELVSIEKELRPHRNDDKAIALYVQTLAQMGRRPSPKDLAHLRRVSAFGPALAEIYGSDRLSEAKARDLASKLPQEWIGTSLARADALSKAGVPGARRTLAPLWAVAARGIGVLVGLGIIVASIALWAIYLSQREAWSPKGLPNEPATAHDADRMALRAAALFAIFLVSGAVLGLGSALSSRILGVGLDARVLQILQAVLMVAAVGVLARMKVAGHRVTLGDLGIGPDLGRNVLIGLAGFAMELPISLGAGALGERLFRFLPTPTHPASVELMQQKDPLTIAAVLMFGAVAAPVWEETAFRGLLFPAMSKLTGTILRGALLSSFAFAAIHPQGVAAWIGLASVALMSCGLVYHTRSLVPSIVMHAAHNLTLLLAAVLFF